MNKKVDFWPDQVVVKDVNKKWKVVVEGFLDLKMNFINSMILPEEISNRLHSYLIPIIEAEFGMDDLDI